jgi:hypothetical protein
MLFVATILICSTGDFIFHPGHVTRFIHNYKKNHPPIDATEKISHPFRVIRHVSRDMSFQKL